MPKHRTSHDEIHDLHEQQDRDLASKVGLTGTDHMAGIEKKIPLRVTSEPVQQGTQTIRKEKVVPNHPQREGGAR